MKKEVIVAIFLGLSLGLLITYAIYRSKNTSTQKQISDLESNPASSPDAESLSNLAIHSPEDEIIVDHPDITVAGDTAPGSFVVIYVNDEENLTTADDSGSFSIAATLEEGSNVIIIYAIDEDGNATTRERVVIYTTEPITDEEIAAQEAATNETPSEEKTTQEAP